MNSIVILQCIKAMLFGVNITQQADVSNPHNQALEQLSINQTSQNIQDSLFLVVEFHSIDVNPEGDMNLVGTSLYQHNETHLSNSQIQHENRDA